ncbi:MAG: purine-nucleoside phosphorylase, partial [Planctomycetes bacterium]|nr:purine-nucleoside phosphorylase [Planctomycetota bacterium]
MTALRTKIDEAAEAIARRRRFVPHAGIVLGTGLGALAGRIANATRIPYAEIPHFPEARVATHDGTFILGEIEGLPIAAMEGRYHFYEGYSLEEITLPIRVIRRLGAKILIVSNAAGGLDPRQGKGDVVLIEDHINLMGVNPLIGPNDDALGPRFPDMYEPYARDLLERAEAIALAAGIRTHRGVYAAVTGPNLETRAEYRALRAIGADIVGMSTVPEVIVAVHAGLRVLGISVATDLCAPEI